MFKSGLTFCLMLLLTLAPLFAFIRVAKAEPVATVYVDPPQITGLRTGSNFTINVKVANVSHLAGWEFQLFFSSQMLNATGIGEGSFLSDVGNTFFYFGPPLGIDNGYNSTHGRVWLACAILGQTDGASGSGTLANVTFQVVAPGASTLTLPQDTTKILDSTPEAPQPIPHVVMNGLVTVAVADVGITEIRLSKTATADPQVIVNVTAVNLGNLTADFNVTVYFDTYQISAWTVTDLAPSTSIILTFACDLTVLPKGNYTISAYASPVLSESNVENNRLTDGWIRKTITGDLNGDGRVNIIDVTIAAKAFKTVPGDPAWNPDADMDNNGVINIIDVTKVAKEFGKVDL